MIVLLLLLCGAALAQGPARFAIEVYAGDDNGGDGGPAVAARLVQPEGLATDADGNLYIADPARHRVRRVSSDGVITTVAGNGTAGFSGDGGPAAAAMLRTPYSVAASPAGELYIADYGNQRIRAISRDGVIRTVAGGGADAVTPLGYDPLAAALAGPRNVAYWSGELYISDHDAGRIYRLAANGLLYPLIGRGLKNPAGICIDPYGGLYVADSGAGTVWRHLGAQASVVLQTTGSPSGVALDAAGNLYVADPGSGLRRVSPGGSVTVVGPPARDVLTDGRGRITFSSGPQVWRLGGTAELVAGTREPPQPGEPARNSALEGPIGLAADGRGNLYVAEEAGRRVRRIDAAGRLWPVAGTGEAGPAGDGEAAVAAPLRDPVAVAADPVLGLRIADFAGNRVRAVDGRGVISTAAGSDEAGDRGDGGPAVRALLNRPRGLAFDGSGNLYIADSGNHRIRRIGRDGEMTTVAGGDGQLHRPSAVAATPQGDLWIADSGNNTIRRLGSNGGMERAAVGVDMQFPTGLAWEAPDTLWIADTFGRRLIRWVAGKAAEIVEGPFDTPAAIAVGAPGEVFVADPGSHRIYRVTRAPASATSESGLRVLHAATMREGPVAPRQLIRVEVADAHTAAFSIDGVRTVPLAADPAGAMLQVPATATGQILVEAGRLRRTVAVARSSPGLFTTGGGLLAGAPRAARGSVISLFATGEGLQRPDTVISLTVGAHAAEILWAGEAPGWAGVLQVNARLPGSYTPPGRLPVTLTVHGASSPEGAYIVLE